MISSKDLNFRSDLDRKYHSQISFQFLQTLLEINTHNDHYQTQQDSVLIQVNP